ncbi:hypothetical protein PR048_009965 [Dryococelus australis]|uniref:Uncharacterized protein n=1 Tax=Dryococelus australis TaxID=614101 RepID=A0ABQ9I1E7_9NEOP|nr:hypothetical protein PR048_009965 [Dryococelus australis]
MFVGPEHNALIMDESKSNRQSSVPGCIKVLFRRMRYSRTQHVAGVPLYLRGPSNQYQRRHEHLLDVYSSRPMGTSLKITGFDFTTPSFKFEVIQQLMDHCTRLYNCSIDSCFTSTLRFPSIWRFFPRSRPRSAGAIRTTLPSASNCPIAAKRKGLNYRTAFSSHCFCTLCHRPSSALMTHAAPDFAKLPQYSQIATTETLNPPTVVIFVVSSTIAQKCLQIPHCAEGHDYLEILAYPFPAVGRKGCDASQVSCQSLPRPPGYRAVSGSAWVVEGSKCRNEYRCHSFDSSFDPGLNTFMVSQHSQLPGLGSHLPLSLSILSYALAGARRAAALSLPTSLRDVTHLATPLTYLMATCAVIDPRTVNRLASHVTISAGEVLSKHARPPLPSGTFRVELDAAERNRKGAKANTEEIWTALNIEDMKTDEGEECKGGGKREIPEKTRGPAASSGTIPPCDYLGTTRSGNRNSLTGVQCSRRTVCIYGAFSAVRLLASHHDEPGSIPGPVTPGFPQVGIVPDDGAGQQIFLGDLPFPPPLEFRRSSILTSFHPHQLISLLRATQTFLSATNICGKQRYGNVLNLLEDTLDLEPFNIWSYFFSNWIADCATRPGRT